MNTISNKQATELKQLAHKTPTSEVVLTALALRNRMREDTDLGRFKVKLIKESGNISDNHYLNTFQELERIGMGAIIYGRKKKPIKFVWKYNLKEVGLAAIDSTKQQAESPREEIIVAPMTSGHVNVNLKIGKAEVKMDFKDNQQALDFLKNFATA